MYVLQNNRGIQSETNTHGLFQIQSGNTFSELEILFEKKKKSSGKAFSIGVN